jgi:hypothetical protein
MAYSIKNPKLKEKKKISRSYQVEEQRKINHLLFGQRRQETTEPKLLTIIVRKDKEHFFNFLKNETEFEVFGKWHSKKSKVFEEENEEIEVIFYDDKQGTKSNLLISNLKKYNRRYIGEQVLYTRISPIDRTSIK